MRRGTIIGPYMVTEQSDGQATIAVDVEGDEVIILRCATYERAVIFAAKLRKP